PVATSWRNMVRTVLAVVVVYQTERSYWWAGVTLGAQDGFSTIMALRSPLLIEVTVTFITLLPVCPGWATANENALLPHPAGFQQTGKLLASTVSRPGLA